MEFMMSAIEASSFLNSDFASSTLPNFIYVGLLGFMLAISLQLINIPFGIYLQLIVPQKIKGRVLSTMALVAASLMPLGTIIYGVLYDLGGCWLINLVSGGSIAVITYC